MEEQPAVNTQVQQTPINPVPVSKKSSQWIIVAIILIVIVFIGSVFTILLNSQRSASLPPSSISPTTPSQPSPGQEKNQQLGDAATKEECLSKGGVWQKWGLAQLEYCQIPAKDAGKLCTHKPQCIYGCISETGAVPGRCATYKNTFGCFSVVNNGKVEEALCVD